MAHGRSHDEREQKIKPSRSNNSPERDSFEHEQFVSANKGHGTPGQYLVGAHEERFTHGTAYEEEEPVGEGADTGLTETAIRYNRERRARELAEGKHAGLDEEQRDQKTAEPEERAKS